MYMQFFTYQIGQSLKFHECRADVAVREVRFQLSGELLIDHWVVYHIEGCHSHCIAGGVSSRNQHTISFILQLQRSRNPETVRLVIFREQSSEDGQSSSVMALTHLLFHTLDLPNALGLHRNDITKRPRQQRCQPWRYLQRQSLERRELLERIKCRSYASSHLEEFGTIVALVQEVIAVAKRDLRNNIHGHGTEGVMEVHARKISGTNIADIEVTELQASNHFPDLILNDGFHIKYPLAREDGIHRPTLDLVHFIGRRTDARVRHAKGIVEVGRLRVLAANVVDLVVVVRVGGNMDLFGRYPDDWTILLVQPFNFQVVPAVVVRLVEFGDCRKKWPRYLYQRVEESAIDTRSRDVDQYYGCYHRPLVVDHESQSSVKRHSELEKVS